MQLEAATWANEARNFDAATLLEKTPDEIVQTLDAQGASDHLPFMPEMLESCGRRFRVSRRALTLCFSGPSSSRGFRTDDVVTLDGVRCFGAAQGDYQKGCIASDIVDDCNQVT